MTRLAIVMVLAAGCGGLCEDDVAIPDAPAAGVRLELGVYGAGRPVWIHAASGALLFDGETDAGGAIALPTVPGDAALTVDLGPGPDDNGEGAQLISYVGLTAGETLALPQPRGTTPTGAATVTVRFPPLDDARVAGYYVDLGSNCGYVELDAPTPPPALFTADLTARCPGEPGIATAVATDADRRFVGVAAAALDLDDGDAATVDVGAWHTDTAAITFAGAFSGDTRALIVAEHAGVAHTVDSALVTAPTTMPDAPDVFDDVELQVFDARSGYEVRISDPEARTVDAAAMLPPVTAVEVDGAASGHPTVSWAYAGPSLVAVAGYAIDETSLSRIAIRAGGGCHVTFPPLPPGYEDLVPPRDADEFHVYAGLTIYDSPDLDPADARAVVGELQPDVARVWSSAFHNVTIAEVPDPS